jgi:bifunctional non-homologous end joining protein LigD
MRRAAARRRKQLKPGDLRGAVRLPYPGFIEPCLATSATAVPARGTWLHEIKHDGYRAQGHLNGARPLIYTRNGYDWTQRFARIAEALKQLPARQVILDGEIVVTDARGIADFHLLQDDLAAHQTDRLACFVFDLLYLDGFDLRGAPLMERRKLLEQLFEDAAAENRPIQLNPYIEADAAAVFEQACAMHLEGIVSKDTQSVYRSGRQDSWIKIKCAKTDTFPIIAFVEKLGASPRRIASLYLGRWEGDQLLYAGKAQTGFKQRMLYELREHLDPYIRTTSPLSIPVKKPKATWVEPAVLAEIEYSALTAERRLRAPIFKGIRDDLMAPRRGPRRTERRKQRPGGVSPSNILQLLPDAIVPTQDQLTRYWRAVATEALPYIVRRPLKFVRHERGTTYYHKGRLPPVPESVHQLQIEKREGGTGTRLWVDDLPGLLGLIDMGVVELHAWNSTVDDIEHPDQMVFDLDPGPGVGMGLCVEIAVELRELLRREGLDSWPKLTGGKGVHVMVPLADRTLTHDEAHRFSRIWAEQIAGRRPDRLTTSAALTARDGRLFIDYLRNGRGTTAVATYSPRARRGFPIAAPISWRALERGIRPDAFTISRPWSNAPPSTASASAKQTANAANTRATSDSKANRGRRQKPMSSPRDADT